MKRVADDFLIHAAELEVALDAAIKLLERMVKHNIPVKFGEKLEIFPEKTVFNGRQIHREGYVMLTPDN